MPGIHPREHDLRGNNRARAARRLFLWNKYRQPGKNYIRCFHCNKRIFSINVRISPKGRITSGFVIDRYPICAHDGGTYRRDNIVPSCFACNAKRAHLCQINRCKAAPKAA